MNKFIRLVRQISELMQMMAWMLARMGWPGSVNDLIRALARHQQERGAIAAAEEMLRINEPLPPEEDGPAKRKMMAIKGVWELFLQSKFNSQSSLQPAFFKLCNQAFRTQDIDKEETTVEQYTAAAEVQVEPFLKNPAASISFELLSIILPQPPKNRGW